MGRTRAALTAVAALVLAISGVTGQANAEGADPATQRVDLQYCQSIPHGRVCFDITGLVHATVTPSGTAAYATNEEICAWAIQATPQGNLTYDDCQRYQEHALTKEGVLAVMGAHSQGTFTRSLAGSSLTCTYRLTYQEVAGQIQFATNDLECTEASDSPASAVTP
jgi:hypothetical protein